jgi:hypothetical protein
VNLDLQDLLTIDVASELRKLCAAQIEGPWQLPAELVRRAVRAGASGVNVTFTRRGVLVADDGSGLDPTLVRSVAVLLDGRESDARRHAALTALEGAGELALLALGGVDRLKSVSLRTTHGRQRYSLAIEEGLPVLGVEEARGRGTEISVEAAGLDRTRAASWLAEVARFAPVPVMIDGAPLAAGFTGTLVEAGLRAPLHGRIALPASGDTAVAFLLAHGIVTSRMTVPDAPAFEAAVEVGEAAADLTPARLREALTPHLPALIDQAVDLIASAAAACPMGSEPVRARLAHLALQAAQRTTPARIERAAVFRVIAPAGGGLASLAALREAAGATGTLLGLSPQQPLDRYTLGPRPVVIAGDAERSLLAEVLGVRFVPPTLRASTLSIAATLRRAAHATARAAQSARDTLRLGQGRPLEEGVLTAAEVKLLVALRPHLLETSVAFCAGRGRPRKRGQTLMLPREDDTVVSSVRAYEANPRWLRQIYLSLTGTTRGAP